MEIAKILTKHKLKKTSCREGILEVVISAKQALSENEIRSRLSGNYNRTTFYRSFKTLVEHRIFHKIVIDNQVIKYELDNSISSKKDHAHFYCNSCNEVSCLETVELSIPNLPNGYKAEIQDFILKGECDKCSHANSL